MIKRLWHKALEGLDPKGGHQGSARLAGGRGAIGRVGAGNGNFFLGRVYGRDRLLMGGVAPKLYHKSKQHLLLVGGSRAGKMTRILMPNILDHPGASIIHDPKGELAGLAALALHQKGRKVYIFDPFDQCKRFIENDSLDPFICGYNPLFDINPFDQSAEILLQALSHIVIKEDKTSNSGPYWTAVNRQVAQGLLAWASVDWTDEQLAFASSKPPSEFSLKERGYLCQHNNLIQVAHFNEQPTEYLLKLVDMMANYEGDEKTGKRHVVGNLIRNGGANARLLLNKDGDADGMRSFLTTFSNEFMWAKSEAMGESLAGFDMQFTMRKLKTEADPVVFVVVPKAYMGVVRPWMRMLFSMALNACELNAGMPKSPINMILDEAPQLGNMPEIEQAFAMSAGQGVRVVYVCQDLGQIKRHFGESWETMIGNSAQMVLSVSDNCTTHYFSEKIGRTYQKDEKTKKKGQEKVEVFTPDEIAKQTHPDRKCGLYLEGGANPQKVALVDYFEDKSRRPGRDYRAHPHHVRPGKPVTSALGTPKAVIALEDHRSKRRAKPVKASKAKRRVRACS